MKTIFSAFKAKFFPLQTESGGDDAIKDMCLLDHIEKIIEVSKRCGIEKCLIKGKTHIDYVAGKLGINPVQAVLFSHFMEKSDNNYIMISEIAESIKCSKVRIMKYMNDCDELEKKRLIRCSRSDLGIYYRIPRDVRESLRKSNGYIAEKNENLSIHKFFAVLKQFFVEKGKDELNYETIKIELLDLINQNMHLMFCKNIMSYDLNKDDLVLLVRFCDLYGNFSCDSIVDNFLSFLYDAEYIFSEIKGSLVDGSHALMEAKLVEYTNENGIVTADAWKLSDKAKKELMSELIKDRNYRKSLIQFDAIRPKKMFYNPRETAEIQKLISLLSDENYHKIQDRLEGSGMRKGFACLFSGGPGTGKTETAYQIARKVRRNIMMVDISATKSKWYGESEKKIKEIFDAYRTAVEKSKNAPILLFNEADAVIGKRKEFTASSRAVDQTDNTIQNIILSEMETLPGIMIATTNLTHNMDKAFERRFLYKITFDRPGLESRMGIWSSLLPGLPEESARELSSRFELSGGQIENIARKTTVDDILNGNGLSLDILVQYCKAEISSDFNAGKRIGFTHE